MYLTLIRHASASHEGFYRDFDRPLTKKGIDKIKKSALLMDERGWKPDFIVSSSAARAFETALIYLEAVGSFIKKNDIITQKKLYLPTEEAILEYVQSIDNKFSDVFLFSHNTGISWAAQLFCNDNSIILPTGSALRIKFSKSSWQEVNFGLGQRIDFIP